MTESSRGPHTCLSLHSGLLFHLPLLMSALYMPSRKEFPFPNHEFPKQGKSILDAEQDSEEVESQDCVGTRESGRPQIVGVPESSLCF